MLQNTLELAIESDSKLSEVDWRVLATIIDTEGTICTVNPHGWYEVKVHIAMTSKDFIDYIHSLYRANSYKDWRGGNYKPQFHWGLTGFKAIPFLQGILPHLIIKKRQAELALELLYLKKQFEHYCPYPAIFKVEAQAIHTEIRQLNKTGLNRVR